MSHKIALKKDPELYLYLFAEERYRDFEVNLSSTTLVIDNFYVKYCTVLSNAVLENGPQIDDNFLIKKIYL